MRLQAALSTFAGDLELDVAIDADAGETVAVVGPNGAGKTTLLRTLAGLRSVATGRIQLGDDVLDDASASIFVPPEYRPIGMVFQDNKLFPHLTALDNVAFGLRARGVAKAEAKRRATGWLAQVGLADRSSAKPAALSGGQAQRVALARALAVEPTLLLLDEPLAALDATTRNELRHDLRTLLSRFVGARVVVTHDPIDAAVLADRIVVLDAGRVVQQGAPAEITARPRTPWVASLVGTNLYAGHAARGEIALSNGGTLHAPADAPSGPVFVVVHPRAVSVHVDAPSGSPRNGWPGRVVSVEIIGDRRRVRIDATPPIIAELTASAATELALEPGRSVWVAVKATELDVFTA